MMPPFCAVDYTRTDEASRCVGSICSRWVPEIRCPYHGTTSLREPNEVGTVLTGRGVCSDNLRAFPWADPAGSVR